MDGIAVCRFSIKSSVVRLWFGYRIVPIEPPVGSNFRKETQGVRSGPAFGVGCVELDDLDVVPEQQHPLFLRGGVQQFANVPPATDERLRVFRDPQERFLPPPKVAKLLLKSTFFRFQPGQFRLYTGEHLRPVAFENFDQAADVRLRLLLLAAKHIFVLPQFFGF